MPKVKTTYAHKIQSIVKEFSDEFMESSNNQLYCNLCNCAVSCKKSFFLFKVLRASGLMKEINTNSVSIRKLNGLTGDSNSQPLDCWSIALPIELIKRFLVDSD